MQNTQFNEYNQEIGFSVENFSKGDYPKINSLTGQNCIVEHLTLEHEESLYKHLILSGTESDWTYLPEHMPKEREKFHDFLESKIKDANAYFLAIIDKKTNEALGIFSLMRINEEMRTLEIGHVVYSQALMHTTIATEAQYLVARYVFEELHYRRYEWKCDSLNKRSFNAALRLGFSFEGIFRQIVVYKGRNRDTAWFSMLDCEWPSRKARFEQYLAAENFDVRGQQKLSLSKIPL